MPLLQFLKCLFGPLYKGWGWNQLIVTRLPSYERKLVSEYLTVNKTRHQQTVHQLAPSLRAGKDWFLFIRKVNRNISNSWERTMIDQSKGPFTYMWKIYFNYKLHVSCGHTALASPQNCKLRPNCYTSQGSRTDGNMSHLKGWGVEGVGRFFL